MPINLQNPGNIATGWGQAPDFHAPNLGEILRSILANRLAQQELTQKSISGAIKNFQTQREDSAYTEALRNAGLTQGQDISGLSAAEATRLAQMIQGQTPDTQSDALKQAMAAYYNKLATTGGTRGGPAGPRPMTEGQQFQKLKTQAGVLGSQADELEQQQEDYGLPAEVGPATHGYVMRDGKLDYARTPEEQANPQLVSPGDPLAPGSEDRTFTPDVYRQRQEQSKSRKDILAEKIRIQQRMLLPQGVSQNDVDQVNQATADPSGSPPPVTSSASGARNVVQLRQEAQDAIANGKDPVAVKRRFRELTGGEL